MEHSDHVGGDVTISVIMRTIIFEYEHGDSVYDKHYEGRANLVEPQGGQTTFQDFLHVHLMHVKCIHELCPF
jgi:hypothetical protein